MIKIDMGKTIYISDDLPKQIHDNQIEVIINECPDGAREIIIQPWEPASNYAKYVHESEESKEEVKHLEEEYDKEYDFTDFEIGDEVIAKDNMKNAVGDYYESFIITGMFFNNVIGFGKKYKIHSMGINDVIKTGRHFTKKEIDVLKEYLEIDGNDQF